MSDGWGDEDDQRNAMVVERLDRIVERLDKIIDLWEQKFVPKSLWVEWKGHPWAAKSLADALDEPKT